MCSFWPGYGTENIVALWWQARRNYAQTSVWNKFTCSMHNLPSNLPGADLVSCCDTGA